MKRERKKKKIGRERERERGGGERVCVRARETGNPS